MREAKAGIRFVAQRAIIVARRMLPTVGMLALLGAGSVADTPAGPDRAVTIDNFTFNPHELVVPVGSRVVWTNRDDIPHTVVGDGVGALRSAPLDSGDQFAVVFTKPGKFHYFCSIHPKMQGTIIVR